MDEAWFRFSFKVKADREYAEQRQAELGAIVRERNKLIHQLLGEFDQTSTKSCRKLGELLDEQAERVCPEFAKLQSLVVALCEGRKAVIDAMTEQLKTDSAKVHE